MNHLSEKDFIDGLKVSCTIKGKKIANGKLHYCRGKWYICQNLMEGTKSDDREFLGYKYSWCISEELDDSINLGHPEIDVDELESFGSLKDKLKSILEQIA